MLTLLSKPSDQTERRSTLTQALEALISDGNDRLDVMVFDKRFDVCPVKEGIPIRQLYPEGR